MKYILSATLAFSLASSSVSYAHDHGSLTHKARYLRAEVVKKFGPRAAGRDIIRYGIRKGKLAVAATNRQKADYIRQLRKLLKPVPVYPAKVAVVASQPSQPPARVLTRSYRPTGYGGSSNAYVNPNCESGGNSQVVSSNGMYWGKYQFDRQTWVASGGSSGSYGNASAQEQDRIAANVKYDAWPNC